jgi:hypothetical protein
MFFLITALIAIAASTVGYIQARRFVSSRLRFVDAAQNRFMPVVAGVGSALLALLVVPFLPLVGAGTALSIGLAVGAGAAVGAKDVRLARYKVD